MHNRTDLNNSGAAILGRHWYSGRGPSSRKDNERCKTFSVGIWVWRPGSRFRTIKGELRLCDRGPKHSPVLVRVSGSTSNPEAVYARAREIVEQLDAGIYTGPKHVRVKP